MICHKTIPIQVWVDIDEGIADMVRYLNTIDDVRTHASCQGTIGYRPYVMVTWTTETALQRLANEFDLTIEGNFAYAHPKEKIAML